MKLNKVFAVVNILFCILITLLNQRQETVWLVCGVYILISFLAISFFKDNKIFKTSFLFKFIALLVVFFLAIIFNNQSINWIKYLTLSFIPLVIFLTNFYLFKNKYLSINMLILAIMFIAAIASYKIYFVSSTLKDLGGSSFQTNWSNLLGACLPIIFLIKKKKFQYVFLFFVGFFILIGLKRTGMIALFITSFVFVFFNTKGNKIIFSLKWSFFTLFIALVSYTFYFKNLNLENVIKAKDRIERLSEDGGSGRDNIYRKGFLNWIDNDKISLEYKIIGNGYYGFKRKAGFLNIESAHNDILDFCYDYGVFAVLILLLYYLRLFKILFLSWKSKSQYFQFILSTIIIFFVYSSFSALYHYFFFFIPLIICLSLIEVITISDENKLNILR